MGRARLLCYFLHFFTLYTLCPHIVLEVVLLSHSLPFSLFSPCFEHLQQALTMAAWTAAGRQLASLSRLSSPSSITSAGQASKLIQRRGLSGGGDHHGPPKVAFWKDPMSPSKWKEEHFVIISLTGWGLTFYSAYKFFTKGKKEEKPIVATQ